MTQTATKDDERQGRDADFDRAGRGAALNVLIVDADARETLLVARCLAASGAAALYGVGEKIGPVVRYGRSFRDTLELGEGLDRAIFVGHVVAFDPVIEIEHMGIVHGPAAIGLDHEILHAAKGIVVELHKRVVGPAEG